MTSLVAALSDIFGDAFVAEGLDRSYGEVGVSQRPELAQFQCNGALAAAKPSGRNPRELAEAVTARVADERIAALSIAGPGFINITVSDDYLAEVVEAMRVDERLSVPLVGEPRTIVVDYGGPNVAKELHIGHLRVAVIGEAIKRLLRWLGHRVIGDVHLGDWGTQMGQLIVELSDRHPDWPFFDPDNQGPFPEKPPITMEDFNEIYPTSTERMKTEAGFAERARQATVELQAGRPGYRALWEHFRTVSIDAIRAVYDRLNVDFDVWHGESTIDHLLGPVVAKLLEDGVAEYSDGAIVVDVAEPDDRSEIPPLMLVKSDGASLYTSWDVATIQYRVEEMDADVIIYVVDARQSLHFEQVFRVVRKAGIAPPHVVLSHDVVGTVNDKSGKPLRTREGGIPLLRGVIDEAVHRAAERLDENEIATEYPPDERAAIVEAVGMAAVKYGDLLNHRSSNYNFDLDRFVSFTGKTGPYVLYGSVRIQSILRNAAGRSLEPGAVIAPEHEAERNLMLRLLQLEEILERSAEFKAPNHLAEYAYELTTDFNRFYEACHILNEQDPRRQASWLGLVDLTLRQLRLVLDLLAITVPERM